jgi:hypothetical protein
VSAMPDLTPVLERRFRAKYVELDNGCWYWTGAQQSRGYGSMGMGPRGHLRTHLAHRLAHHWFIGPIPEGMTVDHLCHNADKTCPGGPNCPHRRCVNQAHLEAVTRQENERRADIYSRPGGRYMPPYVEAS